MSFGEFPTRVRLYLPDSWMAGRQGFRSCLQLVPGGLPCEFLGVYRASGALNLVDIVVDRPQTMRTAGGKDWSCVPPSWWGLLLSSFRQFPGIASLQEENQGRCDQLQGTKILSIKPCYIIRVISDQIEIQLHLNMNQEDDQILIWSWQPLVHPRKRVVGLLKKVAYSPRQILPSPGYSSFFLVLQNGS